MARLAARTLGLGLLLFGLVGCSNPAGSDLVVEPIQIDSVEVLVAPGSPATVAAHVLGVVGDGCSTLHSVQQQRADGTIVVTILRQRPRDAVCTQIALLYDQRIPLQGSFPAGEYLLRVNGVEQRFRVD